MLLNGCEDCFVNDKHVYTVIFLTRSYASQQDTVIEGKDLILEQLDQINEFKKNPVKVPSFFN
jgi:hypothetical protein